MLCDFVELTETTWICRTCGRQVLRGRWRPDQIRLPCRAMEPAPRTEPSKHLGEATGALIECATCGDGRTQLKVYACSHPAHGETTLVACQACPDFVSSSQQNVLR